MGERDIWLEYTEIPPAWAESLRTPTMQSLNLNTKSESAVAFVCVIVVVCLCVCVCVYVCVFECLSIPCVFCLYCVVNGNSRIMPPQNQCGDVR